MTSILWLRRDLRRGDHPALAAAHDAAGAGGVLPVFVADPTLLASAGTSRVAALHDALAGARESFEDALVVRYGRPEEVLPALVREVRAASIHATAETTPYGRRRDARVRAVLPPGVPLVTTGSPYAVTPGRIHTGGGTPYRVFTPYSRAWRDHGWHRPAEVPARLRWHRGAASAPSPGSVGEAACDGPRVGERAALERWHEFLAAGLEFYAVDRDRPDVDATSGMSVHLKYGTIHPRTMLADLAAVTAAGGPDVTTYVNELCWREFYADVLWHQPASAWTDLRPDLRGMQYDDPAGPAFAAWRGGRTGYPLVDAGMRQLLAEGRMHNRVRMVTASFLVKDLHVWWPHGARHFLAHLRDGDVASNSHGWQWVAGTGTDAAPYFRVLNPVAQGERFDPHGDYVRRYVLELAHVAGRAVHQPWKVAGAYDGSYPQPIVDHAVERAEALRRHAAARS
jgi:deoxyribodipyrimidine photo-lyase